MLTYSSDFIKKICNRNEHAFSTFYTESVDIFYRYCKTSYRIEASDIDDLISSFYAKIWDNIDKYNNEHNFASYIWTIFRNHSKDFLKKKNNTNFSDIHTRDNQSFEENIEDKKNKSIQEILETRWKIDFVQEALATLDTESYDIIFYKYIENKKHSDIAKILSLSEENVRKKISRIIKKLYIKLNHLHNL